MKQIHLRLPDELHGQLVEAKGDVSLNTLIVLLLAGGTGFNVRPKEDPTTHEEADDD